MHGSSKTDQPMDAVAGQVGYLVRVLREAHRTAMEAALRPLGVTPSQYGALSQVDRHPGLSAAQLARLNYVKPQSAHEVVGQLERAGLVRREPHPEIGRVLPIRLTSEGSELLERCEQRAQEIQDQMLTDLTPAERVQFAALLDRAIKSMERYHRD